MKDCIHNTKENERVKNDLSFFLTFTFRCPMRAAYGLECDFRDGKRLDGVFRFAKQIYIYRGNENNINHSR